jgi:hypothetical protein
VTFERDYGSTSGRDVQRRKYTEAQKAGTALGCISDKHDTAQRWRGARWQKHLI